MATANDVAKFFLSRINDDQGDTVTHLKLQKLVYYAQAWSLVLLGRKLFDGCIKAWKNGPVSPDVWTQYRSYADKLPIPKPEIFDETVFSNDELELLNLIDSTYGSYTASKLWKLSHTEHPWLEARRGIPEDANSDILISDEWMRSYYSHFIDIQSKSIHPEVFSEKKRIDSLITIESDGKAVQLRTDNLFQYLESNQSENDMILIDVKPRRRQKN